MSDIKIKTSQDMKSFLRMSKLKQLLDAILEVEAFVNRIERKGIPFREFMAAKNAQGILPRFQVDLIEGSQICLFIR